MGLQVNAQCNKVTDINSTGDCFCSGLTMKDSLIYFAAKDTDSSGLWVTNGRASGTYAIKNIDTVDISEITALGGKIYFSGKWGTTGGNELWSSDGTAGGTQLVKIIDSAFGGYPANLTVFDTLLLFTAFDLANGMELWRSNGTAGGTQIVKNIHPTFHSFPARLTWCGSHAYFQANDGTAGVELWKTDGTDTGTVMVKDMYSGGGGGEARTFTYYNNKVYFVGRDTVDNFELWVTDGTDTGTVMVKDINPGGSSNIDEIVVYNGLMYFDADDGVNGKELWVSDGTDTGTVMLKDINSSGSSVPDLMYASSGGLYFMADNGVNGKELWISDGTDTGTVMVKDINSGVGDSNPGEYIEKGGKVYFSADNGVDGFELWETDGTAGGTVMACNIDGGGSSGVNSINILNDTLIFLANDGVTGMELYRFFNSAPVAADDTVQTYEEVMLMIAPLANDSDPDGDSLTLTILSGPFNGSAVVITDSISYVPDSNFFGTDTIVYQICDNGIPSFCDTGMVIITVNNVNDAPVAVADTVTTNEEVGVIFGVQGNDTDIEGDSLFTTILSGPANGNAVVISGSIFYVPDSNFFGIDTIVYQVCDNGSPSLCGQASVIITVNNVNDVPVANMDTVTTEEDVQVMIDVQGNDTDIDGDSLFSSVVSGPSNGIYTIISGDSISYVPGTNFYGTDTLMYVICDNGSPVLCDTTTLIITVMSVNDAPVALADTVITDEETPVMILVMANDSDPDNDSLGVSIVSSSSNGSVAVINDSILYSPDSNFFGTDTIVYQICDNGSPSLCDQDMVIITVNNVNDAPVAETDYAITGEDVAVTVDVLSNDFDLEGDALSTTIIAGASNGLENVQGGDSILYTPNTGYFGSDEIVYQVCDNGVPSLCDIDTLFITVNETGDTTGLPEQNVLHNVRIYPNPIIQGRSMFLLGIGQGIIVVHDLLGKVVLIQEVESDREEINTGELVKGIYTVKYSGKGGWYVGRVVIM